MSKLTTKVVSQRRDQFLASWREYASAATFAGVSLEQFETESKKPLEVRGRMMAVRTQLGGMKLERDKVDESHSEMLTAIANGIRADPAHGPDSPLYRSLGFIPKSERKRPRGRAAKAAKPATPPEGDADAA
jgi:hypothetical protein